MKKKAAQRFFGIIQLLESAEKAILLTKKLLLLKVYFIFKQEYFL